MELIDLTKYAYTEEDYRADLQEEYEQLVVRHANIMYERLADRRLDELECRLLKHPLCNIHMSFAIWQRQTWMLALYYNVSDDAAQKREMLLKLRGHYQATQRWPKAWQHALAPMWAEISEMLKREERRQA